MQNDGASTMIAHKPAPKEKQAKKKNWKASYILKGLTPFRDLLPAFPSYLHHFSLFQFD